MPTISGQVGAFYFYAGVSLLGLVFVYLFVPETKGKTLEEIQTSLFDQSAFSFRRLSNPVPLFSSQSAQVEGDGEEGRKE